MRIQPLFGSFGKIVVLNQAIGYSSVDVEMIKLLLKEHGVLLIRGGDLDRDHFQTFTGKFSHQFVVHGAKVRRRLSTDQTVQTVTEGNGDIVLHSEMHYSPFSPDLLWFFCELAPPTGGETTVCDGVQFFSELTSASQQLLKSKRLRYTNIWSEDRWQTYFPSETKSEVLSKLKSINASGEWLDDTTLRFEFLRSAVTATHRGDAFINAIAIHHQYKQNVSAFQVASDNMNRHEVCLEDGSEIPESLLSELAEIESRIAQSVKWKPSDIVMIDNHSVLHGRRAFDPSLSRSILVRMANWPKAS